MASSLQCLLGSWIIYCTLSTVVVGEKILLAENAQCNQLTNETNDRNDQTCSICVIRTNESHKQGQLISDYVHRGTIAFNDNGTNYLSWNYDDYRVADPNNITVSFNIWNRTANMGQPLKGCCGIPLSNGGCWIRDCVQGITFIAVGYKRWTVAKVFKMSSMRSCTDQPAEPRRETRRFFHICIHANTTWRERYNCECAVYDSVTGKLQPGNHTSELERNSSETGVWYSDSKPLPYQVCVFIMKKDDVMARGSLANNDDVMDSVAFNRGVFYMKGFSGVNGSVNDDVMGRSVNCTIRTFQGAEMFNISSMNLMRSLPHYNNDTFTCLAPWPNGTFDFRPQGTHVRCMPQNETFTMSHVYNKKMKMSNSFVSAMVVFIPLLGAVAMMALICLVGFSLRKKFNKFMKDMKTVPEQFDTVMKESFYDYASKVQSNVSEEKEHCQAFDSDEKNRIFSLRLKEEEKHCSYEISRQLSNSCDPFSERGYGLDPRFHSHLDGHHFNFLTGDVILDPSFVVCTRFPETPDSLRSSVGEMDSGCPPSMGSGHGYRLEDDPSSIEVPYMVRHVTDDATKPNKSNLYPGNLNEKTRSVSMVGCGKECEGYWSKEPFQKPSSDSISRCSSNDTGCGSDCCNEESYGIVEYGVEDKKHPFLKTTSKDSGVSTKHGSLCSLRDSMSDISDYTPEEEFPISLNANFPDRMIVSCMLQQAAAH